MDPVKVKMIEEQTARHAALNLKYSKVFCRFMAEPGTVAEDQELHGRFTHFLWIVDHLVDSSPELAFDESAEERPGIDESAAFARDDVSKFGLPMVKFMDGADKVYGEFVKKMDAHFGVDADKALLEVDKCVDAYIKYSKVLLLTPLGAEEGKKRTPLEKYNDIRMWTGGLLTSSTTFWYGLEVPKEQDSKDAAMICALINDLYDYHRDKEENSHLTLCSYFDSFDEAMKYAKRIYDDVYSRVNPSMQRFIDRYMEFQKDEDVQMSRGFDRELYNKLNAVFTAPSP